MTAPLLLAKVDPFADRAGWLEQRRRGIGGSDAPAIVGVDPYRSAIHVYLEKLGELGDDDAGEAAYWGLVLEDVVAREFEKRNDCAVYTPDGILQHAELPHMIVSLDRWVASDLDADPHAILQIKTASEWTADEWREEGLPPRVEVQVQHEIDVAGVDGGYVAVLIGGQRYRDFEVERDVEVVEMLRVVEADFWQRVIDRRPPPMDGSKASSELLRKLWPDHEPGKQVELGDDLFDALRERERAHAEMKAAERRRDEAQQRICEFMGDAETAVYDGRPVATWRSSPRESYEVKATTVRSFRVKKGALDGQ